MTIWVVWCMHHQRRLNLFLVLRHLSEKWLTILNFIIRTWACRLQHWNNGLQVPFCRPVATNCWMTKYQRQYKLMMCSSLMQIISTMSRQSVSLSGEAKTHLTLFTIGQLLFTTVLESIWNRAKLLKQVSLEMQPNFFLNRPLPTPKVKTPTKKLILKNKDQQTLISLENVRSNWGALPKDLTTRTGLRSGFRQKSLPKA